MTIWSDAQIGKLDKDALEKHLKADPKLTIDSEDTSGLTPLAYAIQNGDTQTVIFLLKNNASVDKKIGETTTPQDLRTPLYLAATARKNRPRVVQLLLEKNPTTFDDPVPGTWGDQTPLMVSVGKARDANDAKVVKQLREHGASIEKKNAQGKTAEDLANDLNPPRQDIKDALKTQPSKERGGLSGYVQGWVFSGLSYFKIWSPLKAIFGAATQAFYRLTNAQGVRPTDPEEFIDEPRTAADFQNNLNNIVGQKDLTRFFPKNDPFIKDIAEKAAALKNDPDNPLKQPSQIQDLANLALYQPVLYCDDSGSMSIEQRWPSQRTLIEKITAITNRAVPGAKGVHLRFINKPLQQPSVTDNLTSEQVLAAYPSSPSGATEIGTNLRAKVLQPLIYDKIEKGESLERPYLVLITTDGCPSVEANDKLREVILECARKLNDKGYRKDAVTFCLSQIGTDAAAKTFLNAIDADLEVQETLHRTSELLDARYQELKDNADELEAWLLVMLLSPLQSINKA